MLAVYLPGGAVSLLLLNKVVTDLFKYPLPLTFGSSSDTAVGQVITAVVWLSASYLVGHIVAFISSYVVEKFVHNKLGYPSDIWLTSERLLHHGQPRRTTYRSIFSRSIAKSPDQWVPRLISFLQLPAAAPLFGLRLTKPFGFYTPKIPFGLLPDVERRYGRLQTSVAIDIGTRWEKVLEHYVSNNCMPAYTRMYNYLVIYGALRMLALIVLGYLWALVARDLYFKLDGSWVVDMPRTIFFHSLSVVYVLAVMAFAKFNRRYFEECILAFLYGVPEHTPGRARAT